MACRVARCCTLVLVGLGFLGPTGGSPAWELRCHRDCQAPPPVWNGSEETSGWSSFDPIPASFLMFWSNSTARALAGRRPIGPTRPSEPRDHPYFHAVGKDAWPNTYAKFCEAGCTFFYSEPEYPSNITCKQRCSSTYAYEGSVGENDMAMVARLECYDGCDLALMRCRPGYSCDWPSTTGLGAVDAAAGWTRTANMTACPLGTWRGVLYNETSGSQTDEDLYSPGISVDSCRDCPSGRYRDFPKGKSVESCSRCPTSRYVNSSGSTSIEACLRCPAGRYADSPGLATCKCITYWSCGDEESFKQSPIYRRCNPTSGSCAGVPTEMRKLSQFYLCRDNGAFTRGLERGQLFDPEEVTCHPLGLVA